MQKYLLAICILILQLNAFSQSRVPKQVIYGNIKLSSLKNNRKIEIPAVNIKVILVEVMRSGNTVNKNICNSNVQKLPNQAKFYYTDFEGSYLFSGLNKGKKYELLICGNSYVLRLTIPPSSNNYVQVPTQTL